MKIRGFQDTIAWYDQNSEKYSQDVEWIRVLVSKN